MKCECLSGAAIEHLVDEFYAKVRRDPVLAPIFADAIGARWEAHLSTMRDFWSAAMQVSNRYKGDMLEAHKRVKGIRPELFGRWLMLFEETVGEHFATGTADALRDRARKIARNLQLALFNSREWGPSQMAERAPGRIA